MAHTIVTLPGDGIGPEILAAATRVLDEVGDFAYDEHVFGGASIDAHGTALTDETTAACRASDGVLLAAVGGPKWDSTDPSAPRPEQGLLGLRKALGLYANLRPVRPLPALYDASPLKRELIEGTDLLVVRELTGGIYFGEKVRRDGYASDLCEYTTAEIERIARTAFRAARSRVTSIDKMNVLETGRLWREVVSRVHAGGVPERRARAPARRLGGDEARQRAAALRRRPRGQHVRRHPLRRGRDAHGLARDAAEREPRRTIRGGPGLFEPVHGSAPDIAGRGIANPLAMILSAALLLRHGLSLEQEAAALESAVDRALAGGLRTADLGGSATTAEATEAVLKELSVKQADLIWMNGELVAWEDAKVHVLTHALHYGTGVFEGVRAYETPRGTAIFRHADHIERLFKSAGMYLMDIPYTREEIRAATHETIVRNGLRSCYIRPLVYRGAGPMGLFPLDCPVDVMIAVWEWGAYLGDEGKQRGVRGKVSSFRRISSDSVIPSAKATGQYVNSVLAKIEASKAGYEEAILLDSRGLVCEGSGENLFVVKDGVISTPGFSADILGGINRASAITIARDLGYEVVERDIARGELYLADEIFMTGTAAELTPLREVDDRPVGTGEPGEITRSVQHAFEDALHGRSDRYAEWLDVVEVPARTA